MSKTLYDAVLKSTGETIFQFKWFYGMGWRHEKSAQEYADNRWHKAILAVPAN